jgi:hypothetical protein
MAGTSIEVLSKTTYTFASSMIATNGTFTIPVALLIPIAPWREATLVVRVHESPTWSAGAGIDVYLYPSAPTGQDPSKVFRGTTASCSVSVTQAQSNTYPLAKLSTAATSGLTSYADLLVKFTQASSGTPELTITISVELVLKA